MFWTDHAPQDGENRPQVLFRTGILAQRISACCEYYARAECFGMFIAKGALHECHDCACLFFSFEVIALLVEDAG